MTRTIRKSILPTVVIFVWLSKYILYENNEFLYINHIN